MSNFFNKLFGKKKDEQQPIDVDTSTAKSSLKLGLALSGGGTRGLAYLGAFRALEENGVHFDYVSGTSVGSLMGAVYASKISLDELEQKAKSVTSKDILTNHFKFMPSGTQKFSTFIKSVLDGKGFGDFEIPLTIVATDIISGNEIWINQGDIGDAIAGSCAVPFIFKPVEFNGYRLYDGGLVNNIPADVVRDMGADIVIAFDINPERGFGTDSTKTWEEFPCIVIATYENESGTVTNVKSNSPIALLKENDLEEINTFGFPDYANVVGKANGTKHYAKTDGYLYCWAEAQQNLTKNLHIEDKSFGIVHHPMGHIGWSGLCMPVSKGNSYSLDGGSTGLNFIPVKGAN